MIRIISGEGFHEFQRSIKTITSKTQIDTK